LHLRADSAVGLACQRCLQRMVVPLGIDRRLFFVAGEDAAASLDAESDDDVLALEAFLDLRSLIEDELLLALPLVPRHEVCPEPLPRSRRPRRRPRRIRSRRWRRSSAAGLVLTGRRCGRLGTAPLLQ
jgi:uncharacterized protein